MSKTRLLIVDSQPIFRAGVRRALAHHDGLDRLEILDCGPGQGGREATTAIEENSPDVALIGIGGPSPDGLELSTCITRNFPATRVIVLSAAYNADELFEVVKTGAAAYLSKDGTTEELSEAIRRTASGEYPINDTFTDRPKAASLALDQFRNMASMSDQKDTVVATLTPREIQFLNLIAEDNSHRQIAAVLGVSEESVKSCVSTILRKLNASDRAHGVMLSLCNNWLSLQEGAAALQPVEQLLEEPACREGCCSTKSKKNGAPKARTRNTSKSGKGAAPAREAKRAG